MNRPDRARRAVRLMRVFVLAGLLAGGCTPKVYQDPIAKMMDTGDSATYRLQAAEQAERDLPDDPARIAALKRLLIERGHPDALRIYAIDALVRHDEAMAKALLAADLPQMNNWPTMQHVLDTAVARGWVDFTPVIVRNYARPAFAYTDAERPEAAALTALHPGESVEQITWAVLVDDPGAGVRERAAAWALLYRLTDDPEALLAKLAAVDGLDDPLIVDLQAAARDLHVTADTLETITWLQVLRSPLYAGFWDRAAAAVASLDAEQRRGLELRHLALVVHLYEAHDPVLGLSRDRLYRRVADALAGRKHYLKSADYDGQDPDYPQRLGDWRGELTWPDLLVMDQVVRLMGDRAVAGEWFTQADQDYEDKSTEYGGLVEWDEAGRPRAVAYPAMIRQHDLKYIPPKSLTINGYAALAHYHFHAQSWNNTRYAGPGRGDMDRIADTQQYSGLVLTFVDRDALNVDYYRTGGVVVDMGTIAR